MINIKKFDLFLIILFLTTSLVALYFIYSSAIGGSDSQNEKVGELSSIQTDVFIKRQSDFFYTKVQTGQPIFNRDQISTGLNSLAVIKLNDDQGQIQLKELSHIIIQKNASGFELNIRSGEMEVESSVNIAVVDKDQTLSGEGSSRFTYRRNQNGSQVNSISGNLKITNQLGESIAPQLPITEVSAKALELKSPLDEAVLNDENYRVNLEWSSPLYNFESYKIKIFDDQKLVVSTSTRETSKEVVLPYSGKFRWHIEAQQNSQNFQSPSQNFSFIEQDFFKILAPENSTKKIASDLGTADIQFKWTQLKPIDTHLILEKADSDLNKWSVISDKIFSTKKDHEDILPLPEGVYRWHLKSEESQSSHQNFEILPKPQIVTTITPKPLVIAKTTPPKEVSRPVVPKPLTVIPPTLSPDLEPKPPEPTPVVQATEPQPEPPLPPVANTGPPPIVPKIIAPALDSYFFSKGETAEVAIKLESDYCSEYEIQVDTHSDFSKPSILTLDQNNGRTKLPNGTYHIRARCWVDGEANAWSIPQKFTIQ